ncbi:MAG: hypothetical protein JSV56_01590 [Methanomassiliicoccales archaeon]|nr:MAG: hypothetical protein JSV56_01590 [Methanomassiliicoccales archaeon]
MKTKQSILEDYSEILKISVKDIAGPDQKYIHFWDFIDLDDRVHQFQARMGLAIKDLKKDMRERYKNYYTRTYIQTPDEFLLHNKELQEIEYMLGNPFFLAILQSTLTKEVDEHKLRYSALEYKKRLMEKRMDIKEELEEEIKAKSDFLVR